MLGARKRLNDTETVFGQSEKCRQDMQSGTPLVVSDPQKTAPNSGKIFLEVRKSRRQNSKRPAIGQTAPLLANTRHTANHSAQGILRDDDTE